MTDARREWIYASSIISNMLLKQRKCIAMTKDIVIITILFGLHLMNREAMRPSPNEKKHITNKIHKLRIIIYLKTYIRNIITRISQNLSILKFLFPPPINLDLESI